MVLHASQRLSASLLHFAAIVTAKIRRAISLQSVATVTESPFRKGPKRRTYQSVRVVAKASVRTSLDPTIQFQSRIASNKGVEAGDDLVSLKQGTQTVVIHSWCQAQRKQ